MQETSLFVGIFVFMRSWNLVLSRVEYEEGFITLGPWMVIFHIMIKGVPASRMVIFTQDGSP